MLFGKPPKLINIDSLTELAEINQSKQEKIKKTKIITVNCNFDMLTNEESESKKVVIPKVKKLEDEQKGNEILWLQ